MLVPSVDHATCLKKNAAILISSYKHALVQAHLDLHWYKPLTGPLTLYLKSLHSWVGILSPPE